MSYVIDFKAFADLVRMPNEGGDVSTETEKTVNADGSMVTVIREYPKPLELDGAKFEIFSKLLELILISDVENTSNVENMLNTSTFGYRLAFETLEERGIIKYIED
jgi:hypothetical protein